MKSENYRRLLNNERDSLEMTAEEFDSTLIHFAELYHKEKQQSIANVIDRLPQSDYIREQAQQMDEKEFDQWWWETIYKPN